ncbi:MAG: hypothetical protein QM756_03490 [Polyangiaceae bacterium]
MPHSVPTATLVALSWQAGAAPLQTSAPLWHGFVGVQASPLRHAVHAPSWHTLPVPQLVPLSTLSVSAQTGSPVPQATVPLRHTLVVTAQIWSATQVTHLPSLQVASSPQAVPLSRSVPVSTHEATPSVHTVSPW